MDVDINDAPEEGYHEAWRQEISSWLSEKSSKRTKSSQKIFLATKSFEAIGGYQN